MLDEENDKKITEAADHYHPEYDDSAWEKMEQLLDKHLPVEKERKRFFFLIPLMLFIGILLVLIGLYNGKNNKPEASQNLLAKNKTEKSIVTNPPNDSKKNGDQSALESNKNVITNARKKNGGENNDTSSVEEKSAKPKSVSSNHLPATKNIKSKKENIVKTNPQEINHEENAVSKNAIQEDKSNLLTPVEPKHNNADVDKSLTQKKIIQEDSTAKSEEVSTKKRSEKIKQTKNSFGNNFGISISAGADVSGVYQNKIGKLTLDYGAGLSYAISQKLNLRTGFYFSKKIYSVGPKDYNLSGGGVGNYAYLKMINANCNVYEIPVKLDYIFGKVKNHNWFVSGGLSSYLMKKEAYDYLYKTPSGEVYNKDWSISNKNKHFFSVLSISGGYQYLLNKQFSIIAEPYVNVPLTGIGAGKVKLNSGGILFTIKAKPFLKH